MQLGGSSSIKPVLPITRIVFVPAAVLAIIAGIQLYVLTEQTDEYFAWTISSPLSAAFLGGGYWSGALLLLFAIAERFWANIRIAIAAVSAFVPLMLAVTVVHLDRVHFAASGPPLVAAWAWMVVYLVVPFALLAVILVQLRAPGGDPPRSAPLAVWIRALVGFNAAISLGISVPLLLFPETLFAVWPWPLTPLTARAIGVGFLTVAVASFQFVRENSWRRGRVGAISYAFIGVLQLAALARFAQTVDWARPGSWLYVLAMLGFMVGGLYSAIMAWGAPGRESG